VRVVQRSQFLATPGVITRLALVVEALPGTRE
jgi:hypothetical protein